MHTLIQEVLWKFRKYLQKNMGGKKFSGAASFGIKILLEIFYPCLYYKFESYSICLTLSLLNHYTDLSKICNEDTLFLEEDHAGRVTCKR